MILKNSKERLQCKIKEIFQNLTGKMRKKNWYNYLINISGKESNNKWSANGKDVKTGLVNRKNNGCC